MGMSTYIFYMKGSSTMMLSFLCQQEQACATIAYCAGHASMENIGGLYMYECWPTEPSGEAQDPSTAAALWELSERIITEKTAVPH